MRLWLTCLMSVFWLGGVCADEPTGLRIGDFFERLALRSPERRPKSLAPDHVSGHAPGKAQRQVQLALVIDATTSMEREIQSLAEKLPALERLFLASANLAGEKLEWSIVLYRDMEAPSGMVTILEPGSTKTQIVMGKLSTVKGETAEPYANNAVDVGIHQALSQLSWKEGAEVDKHLLVIGDSPAYGSGTESRKYSNEQLLELAKKKGVRIHAIRPATVATDPASAEESQRLTNLFYKAMTVPTQGFQIDLAQREQVDTRLGRAVRLEGLDASLLLEKNKNSSAPETSEKLADVWTEFALRHAKSVQDQRELREALAKIWDTDIQPDDERFGAELTRRIAVLESFVGDGPESAALHLHLSLAYGRLAGLGIYSRAAQQRAWHAWRASEMSAKAKDFPESLAQEIEANRLLHVQNDRDGASAIFEQLSQRKVEAANPGSVTRAHAACLRLLLSSNGGTKPLRPDSATEKSPSADARRHLEYLLKESPHSPFSVALRTRLQKNDAKLGWLHEDDVDAPY